MQIDITAVNDAPVNTVPGTQTVAEETTTAISGISIADADDLGGSLTTQLQVSNGVLSVTLSGAAVISSGANGSGDLTIQGSKADINATLASLTYTGNTDINGTAADTLTVTTNDQGNTGSGGAQQDVDTIQIDITAVNDAPMNTMPGTQTVAEETTTAIAGISIADVDDLGGNLTTRLQVTNGALNVTLSGTATISAGANGSDDLTILGSKADINATLATLAYTGNTNVNGTAADTLTVTTNDQGNTGTGGAQQDVDTVQIDITAVNDAPINTVPSTQTVAEETTTAISGISIADVDDLGATLTTQLQVSNGVLNVTLSGAATVSAGANGSGDLTILGRKADINATLATLTYTGNTDVNGTAADTLVVTTNDQGNTGSGGAQQDVDNVQIDITAVNDAPVNTVAGTQTVAEETTTAIAGISIAEVDDLGGNLTTELQVTNGVLSVTLSGAAVISAGANGSGDLTVLGNETDINATLATLTYTGNTDVNGTAADTLTVTTNDQGNTGSGGPQQDVDTVQIDITAVNDAPVNTVPGTQTVAEETATAISGISIADVDDLGGNLTTQLQVTNGVLNVTLSGAATISAGANDSGDLTILGSKADINATLASLIYTGNTDINGTAADTLTVTTNDQGNTGSGGPQQDVDTVQIDITAVNDAPINTVPGTQTVAEETTTAIAGISIADVDDLGANLTTQLQVSNGVLNVTLSGAATISAGANGSGDLTILGSKADINATLASLTYTGNANVNGTAADTLTVTTNDQGNTGTGGAQQDSDTVQIDITEINDAPVVTVDPVNLSFTEQSPVGIDVNASVTDVDSSSLASATIRISAGYEAGVDQLQFTNQNGITGTYNNASGVLSLTGVSSVANYQTAIRSVIFDNQSDDPSAATRTVEWVVNDGGADSVAVSRDIVFNAVNDAPTNTVPVSVTVAEETATGITGISIVDADDQGANLTTRLQVSAGVLNLTLSGSATISAGADGSADLTILGSKADINATLATLTYTGNTDVNGTAADTLTVTTDDLGNTGSGGTQQDVDTVQIDTTAVNDAPVNTVPGTKTVAEEVTTAIAGISIADVDDLGANLTTQLQVSNGVLNVTLSGIATISAGANGSGDLTILGSKADINATLASLTYIGNANVNGTAADTLTVTTNDQGNTGSGGTQQDVDTVQIDITAVNDAPVNTVPGTQTVAEETPAAIAWISIADVDDLGANLTTRLQVSAGVLNVTLSGAATISAGADGSADLTILGLEADINATLAGLTYTGNTDVTGTAADTLTVTTNDGGNTGSGGAQQDVDNVQIDLTAVNDAPVNTVPGTQTVAEETATGIGGISIADVDDLGANLTTQLQVSSGVLSVTLSGAATISAGANGSDDLTILGSKTDINATLTSLTYTGNVDVTGLAADTLTVTTNDQGNTGAGGAQQDVDTVQIDVSPVDDVPTLGLNTGTSLNEGAAVTIDSTMLRIDDVDTSTAGRVYTVTAVPTTGSVRLGGSTLSVGQTFTQDDLNNNQVDYVHNDAEVFSDSFSFTYGDGTTTGLGPETFSLTITPVNDNDPVFTSPNTASVAENTSAASTVTTTDADLPAQTVTYSIVSTGSGGAADAAAFSINGTNGALAFSAAPDFESPGDANTDNVYEVTVRADDGAGRTSDQVVSVTVTDADEPPNGADNTVTVNEDTDYAFAIGDFGFSDPDAGNTLDAVRIDTLPGAGTLTLSSVAVTAGQVIDAADITAGNLAYRAAPDSNGTGYAAFTFSVRDAGNLFDVAPNTMTVDVTAVNDVPVNTVPGTQTVAEETPTAITGISIADADDLGASLTTRLQVTAGVLNITLSGSASISAGANGSGDLTILGTETDINATLASLTYTGNTDVTGTAADTLTVTTNDQGNTGSGGAQQDVDTVQIDISAVNDAPVNTVPSTQTVTEETTTAIAGISIADVDDLGANLATRLQVSNGILNVTLSGAASISAGGNSSGDLTIQGSEADINATLASLTFTGNTDVTGTAADTLTVTTNDQGNTGSGGAQQDADTVQIDITAVNDAPLNTVPGTQSFAEETVTAISGISIADVDDLGGNLTTQLQVSNGVLNITLSGSASISAGSNASDDLTILGTEADINATLASLTYTGNTNVNGTAADTLTVTTNDQGNTGSGGAQQDVDTVQIDITAVNDAPVNTVSGTQSIAEETATVISGISIADVDDLGANLTTRLQVTAGVLNVTLSGAATISAGAYGSADLTIQGTEADINATLASLTYTGNTDVTGTAADTLTVTTNDLGNSGSGGAQQDVDTVQIDLTAANDAPVVTAPGSALSATEQVGLSIHGAGFGVSDVDEAGTGATAILNVGEGVLSVVAGDSGIAVDSGNATGTVTISGTITQIDTLLSGAGTGTITYLNSSDTPGASTVIAVTVNDQGNTGTDPGLSGDATSEEGSNSQTINIAAVNDAPVNTVPGTQTIAEETATAISGVSIADGDDLGNNLSTRVQVSNGLLNVTLSGAATISAGADGSADLTILGTEADINATLASLTYTGNTNVTGIAADTLMVTTGDLGNTGSGGAQQDVDTVQIDITGVNDAPVNTVPGTQTIAEDTATGVSGISIADVDDLGNNLSTRLQVSNGVLNVTLSGSATISAGADATADLTLVGSESDINATLASLIYTGNTNVTGVAADTLTVTTSDLGNTGSGGAQQDVDTVQIDITAVNDTPVNTVPGTQTIAEETTTAVSGISIADVDDLGNNLSTRLQVGNGVLNLTLSGAASISAGSNASADLTILGSESDINATLASLSYTGNTNVTGIAADTLTVTTDDLGNSGSGGAQQDVDTVQIDLTAANDAPVVTAPSGALSATEQVGLSIHGVGFGVSDVDEAGSGATAILNVGEGALSVAVGDSGIAVDSGNATGTVTISGTIAQIDNLLTGAGTGTITYLNSSDAPGASTVIAVTVNDQGNTGADPGLSGDATSEEGSNSQTINIAAVNDAPVNTVPGTQTIPEEMVTAITGISIVDVDAGANNLITRLQVSSGVLNVTLAGSASISLGVNGTADLTVLGSVTDVNNTLASLTYTGNADVTGVAADTLTVTTNDQGNTGSGGAQQDVDNVQIDITTVNDPPVNTVPGTQTVAEETTTAISGISIADVDDLGGNLTTQLQVSNGVLNVTLSGSASIFAGANGSGDLTIQGSESDINGTLASLTYTGNADVTSVAADTLTVTTNDQGNTGSGGAQQEVDNVQIDITAVNDAPVNTVPGTQTVAEETATGIGGISIADVDDLGGNLTTRLQVSAGVVNVTLSGAATISAGANASGDLTILGSEADINTTLVSLTYTGNTDVTGVAADTLTVTTNDQGNTGSGGAQQDDDNVQIDITAVNDAPVNTVPGTQTVAEETATAIAGISIADVDDLGANLTTQLQVTSGVLNVTLSGAASISAGVNGSGDLTIQGTETDINATLASLTYTGNTDVTGTAADSLVVTTNDQGNTGSGGAQQDVDNVQIDITAVDDAPNLGLNTGATLNEGATVVIDNTMLRIDDVDTTTTGRVYTISAVPATGSVRLSGSALSVGQTFTQDDIDNNRVDYVHNDAEVFADSFSFTYSDATTTGLGPETFSLTVTPVNDNDPVFTSANTASVAENSTAVSTVTTTDADLPAQTVTYSIVPSGSGGAADAAQFSLDTNSGALTFSAVPDFESPGDANTDNVYEVTVRADDGAGRTSDQIVSVTVTNANEAPSGADNTVTVNEDTDYAFVIGDFGFSDPDAGNTLDAVRIDTLPGAGTLTLSSVAVTAGQLIGAVDITAGNLAYRAAPDSNGAGYAAFTFSVRDAGNLFNAAPNTMTVDVTAVNDAPMNTVPGTQTVAEETATAIAGISIADVDDLGANLTTRLQVSVGVVNVTLSGAATISAGANGSGDLTILGSETDINATLASLTYTGNTDVTGTSVDTLTVTTNDQGNTGSGVAQQDVDTVQIDITGVNDAPLVTVDPVNLSFTEQSPAGVDTNASISDVDSSTLAGATVRISANYEVGVDQLQFTDQNGISGTYNNGTGVLTLTGVANIANYQTAIRSIVFDNQSDDPSGATRTIEWVVNDGGADSVAVTRDIDFSPVNDAPVNTAPTSATVAEETVTTIIGVSIADADDQGASLTTRLQVTAGVVNVTLSGAATILAGSNGSNDLTILGTETEINATLATLTYTGSTDVTGTAADTLTVTTNDQGNTGSGGAQQDVDTVQIDILAVNDSPVNTVPGTQTVTEETPKAIAGISIADVDDLGGILTTQLQVSNGVLNVTLSGAASISAGSAASADLTIQGSDVDINATLASLSYTGNTDVTGTAADTLTITTNDQGNTGSGGAQQDVDTVQIDITAVNDAPVNTVPGTQTVAEETTTAITDISIADVDDLGANLTTRLQVTSGVVNVTLSGSATVSAGSNGSGDLKILGTETDINATLASLTYTGNTSVNGTAADTLTVTTNDQGNTGSGGTQQDVDTVQVDITAVNDAPVNMVLGTQTVAEETITAISGTSIADIDDLGGNLTTQLQVSNGVLNVTLSGAATISTGFNGSGDLTILGTKADINATLASLTYTGNTNVNGTAADTLVVTTNDQGNTGSGGAQQDIDNVQIDITAVDDAPTIGLNTGASLNEGATVAIDNTMLRVDDVDTAANGRVYTISAVPATGSVRLSGSALSVGQTFTQDDVDNNRVDYVHNDTEVFTDGFSFTYGDDTTGGLGPATLSLTVAPVNDNDPVFTSSNTASVPENTTAVSTVTTTDADLPAQTVTYSIVPTGSGGAADAAAFTINGTSGALTFSAAPDFEAAGDANTDNVYEVTVRADDSAGRSSDQTVQVTVTSVNEAPTGVDNTVTVSEDSGYAFASGDFGFSDPDSGDTLDAVRVDSLPGAGSLTLSGVAVTAGQVIGAADITAGNLVFTPALNANGIVYASFAFSVRDAANAFNATPNTMSVDVAAVNDAPVNTVPGTQTVSEETITAISGISIADADDLGGNLTTQLQVGNGVLNVTLAGSTSIAAGANVSGDLTIQGSEADINATLASLTYTGNTDVNGTAADTLTVTTNDQGNTGSGGARQDVDTVQIDITAVDDLPAIALNTGASLNEGDAVIIGNAMLSLTDVDTAAADRVYTLTATPSSGDVRLSGTALSVGQSFTQANIDAGQLDYRHDDSEVFADAFSVTYRDASSAALGPETFTLTIAPVNDNDPVIQSDGAGASASLSINENVTAVTNVLATDVDLPSQAISYAIIGGADASQFALNGATGELSFLAAVDFETPSDSDLDNVYEVIVEAADGLGRSDTQQLSVQVRAINDTDPVITSDGGGDNASIAHPENATRVTQVSALDNDLPNQTLSYSITGGTDADRFNLDAASGELTFLTAPSFETPTDADQDNGYEVSVSVSDGLNTDQQTIRVSVQDVNEAPGPITPEAIVVSESLRPGSLLGQLLAADPDAADTAVFVITAGEPGLFVLDPESGELSLARDRLLDYERRSRYDITVQVTDSGGLTASQQIQIAVLDEPELEVGTGNGVTGLPSTPDPVASPEGLSSTAPEVKPDPSGEKSTEQAISERLDRALEITNELPIFEDEISSVINFGRVDLYPDLIQRLKSTANLGGDALGFDFDLPISGLNVQIDRLDFEPLVNVRLSIRFDDTAVADQLREQSDSFIEFAFDPIKIGSTLVSVGIVWWLTRAGGLITTILMGIPTWRHLDLLPIVSSTFGDDQEPLDEDKDLSAEEIFGETISVGFLRQDALVGTQGTYLPPA